MGLWLTGLLVLNVILPRATIYIIPLDSITVSMNRHMYHEWKKKLIQKMSTIYC